MSPRQVTLPIAEDDGLRMDAAEAKGLGDLLHEDYVSAQPFPHIVLDGILPGDLPRRILANFPVAALASDTVFNINYGGHFKRQVAPEDCNAFVRELFHFFNSRPMLAFLEGLSGITGLLPDPYFEGGGFHEISADSSQIKHQFGQARFGALRDRTQSTKFCTCPSSSPAPC